MNINDQTDAAKLGLQSLECLKSFTSLLSPTDIRGTKLLERPFEKDEVIWIVVNDQLQGLSRALQTRFECG